jgi:uncharacterized membrane protein HdeD (DUF308 family)
VGCLQERTFYLSKELVVTTAATPATGSAPALRRLYFVRFAFAVIWAALLVATGGQLGPATAALVVLYPLFDVAAAVVDYRASSSATSSASSATRRGLYLNIAVSLVAAIALGIAAGSGVPAILLVWASWAVVAGLIQLAVGITRRALGGQWPMMLSGGISVLAGAGFAAMAAAPDPAVVGVAGYAGVGGIFFLVSALRLGRHTTAH